ncbi:MAG: MraY family glycosyltransferase [Candidatus Pacebacteria bacterium]|nr:MraY family glycosyltransferase [Candidatus Paceibacterota bacterium]
MQNLILYIKPFLTAFVLSVVFMCVLIAFSKRYNLFDRNGGRKKHVGKISRLGGLGIIVAFWLAIFLSGTLVFDELKIGLVICSILILIFGLWDDLRNISWKKQIALQIFIALVMIYFGLGVDYVANPFGGREFRLDTFYFFDFSVLGSFFVILWIVGFMNVVNWLDGLDGLAGGVGAIASLTLFFLSISDLVNQPPLAILAITFVGALLGFLVFNFYPAKIFMGTSGSMFLGFMLAVLAIFAGGKIATVFLVMGFPILDAVWVVYKRLHEGRSPFIGDRNHFHYYLFDKLGWSERRTVFSIYLLSAVLGFLSLIFQGIYKFMVLVILFIIVIASTKKQIRKKGTIVG